ncbi:MAG: ubiquinol-cytochrome C chaperone family protein [Rhizobiaceae bacterium]
MAQARCEAFFTKMGIADTVTGRFDLLALHMFLLSHRLSSETEAEARDLSQAVFDHFTADVDRALREIGIGDTSVPKRKKKLIAGFYGQIADFDESLSRASSKDLTERVKARFHDGRDEAGAAMLANYMIEAARLLGRQTYGAIASGRIEWPEVEDTFKSVPSGNV